MSKGIWTPIRDCRGRYYIQVIASLVPVNIGGGSWFIRTSHRYPRRINGIYAYAPDTETQRCLLTLGITKEENSENTTDYWEFATAQQLMAESHGEY